MSHSSDLASTSRHMMTIILLLQLLMCLGPEHLSTAASTTVNSKPERQGKARTNGINSTQTESRVKRFVESHQLTVRSEVLHRFATTLVTQKFFNDNHQTADNGTAVFEVLLPKTAVVTNFTATVDARQYHAERRRPGSDDQPSGNRAPIYAAARSISRFKQAARYAGRNVFRVEVELVPGGQAEFHLTYEQLLSRRLGVYELSTVVGQGRGPVRDLRVDVRIKETSEMRVVQILTPGSDTSANATQDNQQLRIRQVSPNVVHVTYTPSLAEQSHWAALSDHDVNNDVIMFFAVRYDVRRQLSAGELQVKDGHFVHYFAPSGLPTIDKNIVFVIDCSDSMSAGSKLAQVKNFIIEALDKLRPSDLFNVIAYSTTLRYWNNDHVAPASSANIGTAKAFVATLNASIGANANDAMLRAVDFLVSKEDSERLETRISMVVLIADSPPSTGIVDAARILTNVRQASGGRVSVFTFGLRPEAGYPFLDRLAAQNRGTVSRLPWVSLDGSMDGISRRLSMFYDEIASPLLENVKIRYNEDAVDEASLTDIDFGAYFDGSELVVAGRLKERSTPSSSGLLSVKVQGGGGTHEYMQLDGHVKTPRPAANRRRSRQATNVVERTWAHLTADRLLRKAVETMNDTVRQMTLATVQQIAAKYSFATPLTPLTLRDINEPEVTINVLFQDVDDELLQRAERRQHSIDGDDVRRRPPVEIPKQRDQSEKKVPFNVDNDPHFLITVAGLSQAVCFDVDGHPGAVYQLLHDKVSGVAVNALITAARGPEPVNDSRRRHRRSATKVRTYLGKIAIVGGGNACGPVVVSPHTILVGSRTLSWTRNITVTCGRSKDASAVEVVSGRHVTISVRPEVVVRVLRHVVGPTHPYKVDYLGFYVETASGLSEYTHGLIGQFIHQMAREVHSSLRMKVTESDDGDDDDDDDAGATVRLLSKLTFSGPHSKHRTVDAVLAARRDMQAKHRVPCWHVARNGLGLIRGTPDDYVVPHMLHATSSFAVDDRRRRLPVYGRVADHDFEYEIDDRRQIDRDRGRVIL